MMNLSLISFFILSTAFLSLPSHLNPLSLGVMIFIIIVSSLGFFISSNLTLVAIFILLVYISGILILFSYFFSLIQNMKIFFIPLLCTVSFLMILNFSFLQLYYSNFMSKMVFLKTSPTMNSFFWLLSDPKLIMFLIVILLLSMLFVEKVIGLKQKPLRLK